MDNEEKQIYALHANSVRQLTELINQMHIKKEDIVQIIDNDNGLFLLYYGPMN